MRTTNEICIAVQENQAATEQELRYAVEAQRSMNWFLQRSLKRLAYAVLGKKPIAEMVAKLENGTLESLAEGRNKPVDEWLGPDNIPGSPAQQERMKMGKKIFKAATGVDLDESP